MNKKDKHYFDIAKEISLSSKYPRIHIGAIAVYHNAVIAKGMNDFKSNPTQMQYNKYRKIKAPIHNNVHAEINMLNKIKYLDIDFSKVKIYIYREDLNNHIAMSKPCKACMAYIRQLGIKEIHYTINDGYGEEIYT